MTWCWGLALWLPTLFACSLGCQLLGPAGSSEPELIRTDSRATFEWELQRTIDEFNGYLTALPQSVADAGLSLDESTEARRRIAQIEALFVELRSTAGWLRGASCEDWLVGVVLANTLVSEIEAELEIVEGILGPQTFSPVVAP